MNREINEMTEHLRELREKIGENKAFLQNYLLDPSGDNRPAEDERLRELTALAEEFEEILDIAAREAAVRTEIPVEETFGEEVCRGETALPEAEEDDADITVEYKTHELGTPDGSDNIEGDWSIDGNEEICEAGNSPEESEEAGEAEEDDEAEAQPEENDDEDREEEKKKEAKKKAKKEKKEKEKREKEKKKKAKKEKKEKEKKRKKEEKERNRISVNIYH